MSDDAEAIVLGGGVAGAAAAIGLARSGRRVLLIEREAGPREKVCGEFLGADAAALLDALGLPPVDLGAVPVRRLRLAAGRREASVALPFPAWGLPRRVLDGALLERAADAGATLLRGRAALAATRQAAGPWTVRLAGGAEVRARHLVLATGKHELRGHARPGVPPAGRGAVGLKLHLRLPDPPDAVLLLPGRGFYAGLQPTAGGLANLCAALAPGLARDAARDATAFIALVAAGSAAAARLLAAAQPVWARPMAVAAVPYGHLHRDAAGAGAPEGLYRIGDQFAVVPSLSGDGIAMALAGGLGAAAAIAAGVPSAAFHAAWRRTLAKPMRWAGLAAAALHHAPRTAVAAAGLLPSVARVVARRTRLA